MDIVIALALLKAFTKLSAGRCKNTKYLDGKVAIVTGGARGTGFNTVTNLASRGCKVIVADVCDCAKLVREASKLFNSQIELGPKLDLCSLRSVRDFADEIKRKEKHLDILVHNAHAHGSTAVESITEDKLPKIMQINLFGPFLLTHLLMDLMKKTKESSRVIFVSSILAFVTKLNLDTINKPLQLGNDKLNIFFQFSNSNLCAIAICKEFATRLKDTGITTHSLHPGFITMSEHDYITARLLDMDMENVKHSLFVDKILNFYGKTAREGAQTTLHCATSKDLAKASGDFYIDCMQFITPSLARSQGFRTKLWDLTEKFAGLKPEERLPPKTIPTK